MHFNILRGVVVTGNAVGVGGGSAQRSVAEAVKKKTARRQIRK